MPEYNSFPALLDRTIIERASKFGSAELADGMKGLGYPGDGCMSADMLPIDENTKIVGTAATVETKDGDNFPIHVAIYSASEGYVLVIAGGGCRERAYLGDLIGGAAKAVGLEGLVVDGAVRDRVGLKKMGFPVYSTGYMQRGPSKIGPGRINVPVVCAGVKVNPGDLVLGDADGVTVVPREIINEVLDRAEEKDSYEQKRRVKIAEYTECKQSGRPLPELAPKWVLDMLEGQKG